MDRLELKQRRHRLREDQASTDSSELIRTDQNSAPHGLHTDSTPTPTRCHCDNVLTLEQLTGVGHWSRGRRWRLSFKPAKICKDLQRSAKHLYHIVSLKLHQLCTATLLCQTTFLTFFIQLFHVSLPIPSHPRRRLCWLPLK